LTDNSKIDSLKRHPAVIKLYQDRVKLHRENGELVGKCPLGGHRDSSPSFHVRLADGVYLFNCFGCGKSGNIFQFIEKVDAVNFSAAVRKVEKFVAESWDEKKAEVEKVFSPMEKPDKKLVIPLAQYAPLEKALEKSDAAREWLEKRGISYATARRFHIGFRPSVGKLAGETNSDVADSGWIAVPFVGENGVESIEYRSLVRKVFCRQPGMATTFWGLGDVDPLEPFYVTEGKFDALVLVQAGFRAGSLPSASTKLTPEWVEQLLDAECVYLAGDSDEPGQAAMSRIAEDLKKAGAKVHTLRWQGVKDANEAFLTQASVDVNKFRELVTSLTAAARSQPMEHVVSIAESLKSSTAQRLSDHPKRLRFHKWPSVDKMAILLPGSVMAVSATNTKQGKSVWVTNFTLECAKKGETVLAYHAELSKEEVENIISAYTLKKSRDEITPEDSKIAGKALTGVRYYFGKNPLLNEIEPVLDLIEKAIQVLGADIVVLDHLHFLITDRDREIQDQATAMQRIKTLAMKYGVKFIVVMQPRKANQQNRAKTIHITDIKGSEAAGSTSDAIFSIHREWAKGVDPANPPEDAYEPRTEVHLLGARSKGPGKALAVLHYHGALATFYETVPESSIPRSESERFELR